MKYNEIRQLYEYCTKIGVIAVFEQCWDGYAIRFANGGDVVQHAGSYGGRVRCVEPAIGSRADYTAVSLQNAKRLICRHKERLNSPAPLKKDGADNER